MKKLTVILTLAATMLLVGCDKTDVVVHKHPSTVEERDAIIANITNTLKQYNVNAVQHPDDWNRAVNTANELACHAICNGVKWDYNRTGINGQQLVSIVKHQEAAPVSNAQQ